MENQRIVLIDGRFELLNGPDRIEIFDIRNPQRDQDGEVNPVAAVSLDKPVTDREAGKLALLRLRVSNYLEQSEYFKFLDIFLAAQSLDEAAVLKESLSNGARGASRARH
jgi:hypothetical protein